MTTATKRSLALITGGNRGLGKNMALQLGARGVDVLITYRHNAHEAADVVAELENKGGKAAALPFEAGDSRTFPAFVSQLRAALARNFQRETIDFLVNNAGHGIHASFAETTEAQFDELVNVHLKAPFFLTQQLLPLIADGGRILNLSSGLARFSMPGRAAYGMVKGGVETLTRYMAQELGARRITVNVLAPGAIETDFGGGVVRDNPAVNKAVSGMTALGRAGLPDDIGSAVAMLLSPDSQWITGQRIEASGGMHL